MDAPTDRRADRDTVSHLVVGVELAAVHVVVVSPQHGYEFPGV